MSINKIKTLFILPSLKAGGAERVISTISRKLNKNQFEVTLVVIGYEKDAVYPIDGIDVVFLNRSRLLKAIGALCRVLKDKKPHIVVGSIAHVNRLLSIIKIYFRKTIFVGREASVGSIIEKFTEPRRIKYWRLYKNYYRFLDKTICQSKDMADQLFSSNNLSKKNVIIINNPASENLKLRTTNVNANCTRQIITIGRLSAEKGYDRILRVLSKIKIPFEYTIIGDGVLKEDLYKMASNLNIKEKLRFITYTDDVGKHLSQSDLFIQGSHVEGFPNVLLESCMTGTPCVAMNAPGGTKEIIENGINGYLTDSEDDFLNKIEISLVRNDWVPEDIRNSILEKFSLSIIIARYESLFFELYNTLKIRNR